MRDKSTISGATGKEAPVAALSLPFAGTEINVQYDAEKRNQMRSGIHSREKNVFAHQQMMEKFHKILTWAAAEVRPTCQLFSCYPDLLLKVLSCLTLRDLCRLRVVSKSLDDLVRSELFWGLLPADCEAKSRSSYGAVLIRHVDGYLQPRPLLKDLFICWNSYAVTGTHLVPLLGKMCRHSTSTLNAVSSAGGLLSVLCGYSVLPSLQFQLLVVNPFTGTCRVLPPAPLTTKCHGMKLETKHYIGSSAGRILSCPTYFVFVKTKDSQYAVYRSATESWGRLQSCKQKTLSLRRVLEADIVDYQIRCNKQPHLRGYDAQSDTWMYFPYRALPEVPRICGSSSTHVLFRHKRRILYACTIPNTDCEDKPGAGFVVWQLQQMQKHTCETSRVNQTAAVRWVEVARTPPSHYPQSNAWMDDKIMSIRFKVHDAIVFASYKFFDYEDEESLYPRLSRYLRPLAYDLDKDSWFFLPANHDGQGSNAYGYPIACVEPSFNVKP